MKPALWEIWESPDPQATHGYSWCLQGPNAVLYFLSREQAEKFRDVTKAYLTKKGIK